MKPSESLRADKLLMRTRVHWLGLLITDMTPLSAQGMALGQGKSNSLTIKLLSTAE